MVLAQPFAGLQAQAVGLAERAGLTSVLQPLIARRPWRWIPAALWPAPLAAIEPIRPVEHSLVLSVGGMGAAVASAIGRSGHRVVQIQNPRMRLDRFDLVIVNTHDEMRGANVLISRNALHGVSALRLRHARATWACRLAHLPRPLVAVLVGGSNGRFRLDAPVGAALAQQLAGMMLRDKVGLMLTPSRRTAPKVLQALKQVLVPVGGWVWDFAGDNPYLGMLACADAIIVTSDSVSMISEAAATSVPVLVARLPGRSRRLALFLQTMRDAGRVRDFGGRAEYWQTQALDDTPAVAQEMLHRLGMAAPLHSDAAVSSEIG